MRAETLSEACARIHDQCERERVPMKGRAPLAETRRRIFAQAVRRGVTYRQLATITGTSTSIIHEALASMNTTKNDPLREPVELDSKGRPK